MEFRDTGLPKDERLEKAFQRFIETIDPDEDQKYLESVIALLYLTIEHAEEPPIASLCAALLVYGELDLLKDPVTDEQYKQISADLGKDVATELKWFELKDSIQAGHPYKLFMELASPEFRLLSLAGAVLEAKTTIEKLQGIKLFGYGRERCTLDDLGETLAACSGMNEALETMLDAALDNLEAAIRECEQRTQKPLKMLPRP